MNEPESVFKSQEVRSDTIPYYPFNAYSSLFYLVPLFAFFKNKNNLKLFDFIGIIILLCLTFASLFWWSTRDKYIQLIDIALYSSLIFYIGFYYLFKKTDIDEDLILNMFIILFIIIVSISLIEKNYIRIVNVLGVIFSLIVFTKYVKSNIEVLGILLIVISFVLKICDTLNYIDYNKLNLISGTGWFHILSALGIYFIFYRLNL